MAICSITKSIFTKTKRSIFAACGGVVLPSARISPSYDPAEDATPGGLSVPVLASNSLYPGTGTVELTDGTTTYGPYAIACPTVGDVYKTSTGGDIFRPNGIDQFIRP